MAKKKTSRSASKKSGANRKAVKAVAKPRVKPGARVRPKGGRGRAPTLKARAGKAPKTGKPAVSLEEPEALFAQGCDLAARGFLFDAIALFRQVTLSRAHELADDAWTDIGLCSLKMRLYADALEAFGRVIDEYPDATIAKVGGGKEFGRTAAKARLGRIHALVGIGDRAGAGREAKALEGYADSYIVDGEGNRRTFHELAIEAVG